MHNCSHEGNFSWWEYDQKGIPLCRVCDNCYIDRLKCFNPAVLTADQMSAIGVSSDESYDDVVQEQIESED